MSEESVNREEIVGKVVEGEITNVKNFGAFVRLSNGEEGLVHISEIAYEFVKDITQFVTPGDKIQVKVLARNPQNNKLELSIKRTQPEPEINPKSFQKYQSRNDVFEDQVTQFLKRSEEKQIDIRRNLKNKQGIGKKRR